MSDPLDDMLADAKILADYGWRSGQLQDSRLFEAIAAFETLGARSWKSPETAVLQHALNDALVSIAPTTLSDVKLRNPFMESSRRENLTRVALIAFSILLMIFTARFTILYNNGVELAGQLDRINEARPSEKMAAVARQWKEAGDTAPTETYYRLLDELRDLDSKVLAYNAGYTAFRATTQWWNFWRLFAPRTQQFAGAPAADGKPYQAVAPCGAAPDSGSAANTFGAAPPGKVLVENRELIANFACTENLTITPYWMVVLVSSGADIQATLSVLGQWLLPAFYGALGATIFYMRSILNPVLPDPPVARIVHRIALGGFAGIIFAWFWAPSPDGSQFVGLTINSFAIAFIIGFSIDVLFALLDTLVRFFQNIVNQIGQATPAPAVVGARSANRVAPPPRPPVLQKPSPPQVARSDAAVPFTVAGEGLGDIRAVVLKSGAASVAASGVSASATSVDFSVVLPAAQPAGDWTIELTDGKGATTVLAAAGEGHLSPSDRCYSGCRDAAPQAAMQVEAAVEPRRDRVVLRQHRKGRGDPRPLEGAEHDVVAEQGRLPADEGLVGQHAAQRLQRGGKRDRARVSRPATTASSVRPSRASRGARK